MISQNEWWFNHKFHQKLEEILTREYQFKVKFSSPISWGYTTTSYYIETEIGNVTARLSKFSNEKLESVNTDIKLTNFLKNTLPIPKYIPNTSGEYFTHLKEEYGADMVLIQDMLLRVSEFIEGVPPFDMTFEIMDQATSLIKTLHFTKWQNENLGLAQNIKGTSLLHGDITPSNFLISHNKIVAILDFEQSIIGPAEYDLSKMAVFFWYRMSDLKFEQVLTRIMQKYADEKIDMDLAYKLAVLHANNHIKNIEIHKDHYKNQDEWEKELKFAKKMANGIIT